ncbi:MAG: family 43 glycosylhydrolase [Candidatus Bathyarchaeia archaeon]
MRSLHFKPADGYVGDIIPFCWDGEYHAFYLKRQEGLDDSPGIQLLLWAHAVSTDLVRWEEMPNALEVGGPEDPDSKGCWTGSVIEREGTFHIFYTGHNVLKEKYPPQTVCHATSPDLIHWSKDPLNPVITPDPMWYENDDWRDPFVFWNERDECYWMLITARVKDSSTPRRGCIALAKSKDLKSWRVHPPLWKPYLMYAPECPDLFRMDGRWYLVFSNVETRYRSAEDLMGPWRRFQVESFDSERFYAAKTLSDGKRRLLFGWISSQKGGRDEGRWEWGGHMALPREIFVQPDGSLGIRCPEEILGVFREWVIKSDSALGYEIETGSWSTKNGALSGSAEDGFAFIIFPDIPEDYLLEANVTVDSVAASAGFMLRMSEELESGYTLTLEPSTHRVAFRYWRTWGDPPPHIERPLDISPGQPIHCQVFVEDTILEAFFNGKTVLSARMYNFRKGQLCLFVQNGKACFADLRLARMT